LSNVPNETIVSIEESKEAVYFKEEDIVSEIVENLINIDSSAVPLRIPKSR